MAYPVSNKGYFEVTALAFTPSVAAMGETVEYSVTIKNVSGKTIPACYINAVGKYPSTDAPGGAGSVRGSVYLHGGPSFALASIAWASGASKTFTGSFQWTVGSYALDDSSYVLDPAITNISLSIVTDADFADGTNFDNIPGLCGSAGEYLTLLSKRDNPRVTLDIWREPDDEAVTVAATIRITSDVEDSVFLQRGYTAQLYYSDAHNPPTTGDSVAVLNATIADMLGGIVGSTEAVGTTFSNGANWYFTLVISNGHETSSAMTSIPRAFANVHLSGQRTGGVAFGKFSAATADNPIFECMYPAYFYGGIAQIGSGEANPLFAVPGETLVVSSNAILPGFASGGKKDIYISVPIGKLLTNVTGVQVESIVGWVRNDGGYGLTSGFIESGNDYTSLVTRADIDQATNSIKILIHRSTTFYVTNNQAITFVPVELRLAFE